MKRLFTLFVLLTIGIVNTFAQWSNNAAINNAICTIAGEQAIPKIATCPNGDTYIGYFSNESGNYSVRLQRLDSQGNELWTNNGILISNNPSMTWLTDWDMTADVHNHCIMTWQDIRNGNNNTYAYRISPDGDFVWGANGIALSNNSAFNAAPKVISTPAGNAVFAWMSDNVIIMQKLSPEGVRQWGLNGITLSSTNTFSWPQLMPVGDDDFIMKFFEDSGPPNAPTRHVFAQRYNNAGSPVWASPVVISNAGGISAWTQILPFINDGYDGFYIAWHDDRDFNQMASVWVQHVNSSGEIKYAANGVEASSNASFNHFYPQLASPAGSDNLFVYWNEMNDLQTLRGIYGQKFSPTGTRMWENSGKIFIPISSTDVLPLAARSTPTDMVLFYEQYINAISGHLKAMRIATDGSYVWPQETVTISSVSSTKVHTDINELQNNQWILSWEDDRSGSSDIYAQNILLDGTLGIWNPQFGSISGQVTLTGENADVTLATVTAGTVSVHPDNEGLYVIDEIEAGVYNVSASHPYTDTQTIDNVTVTTGETTTDINFELNVNRTDLICKAVDQNNNPVYDVEINVNGPEGNYTGIISGDSLIFANVPYGFYEGAATLSGSEPVLSDTTINADNHYLIFEFIIGNTLNLQTRNNFSISPNPVTKESFARLICENTDEYSFSIINPNGIKISQFDTGILSKGAHEWPVQKLFGHTWPAHGIYLVKIKNKHFSQTSKIIVLE